MDYRISQILVSQQTKDPEQVQVWIVDLCGMRLHRTTADICCLDVKHSKGLLCLFWTDDAFLARQKAKADAEFYTALRVAEANKVTGRHNLSSALYSHPTYTPGLTQCVISLASHQAFLSPPTRLSVVCLV